MTEFKEITIYGSSDDCIEIEGGFEEEFNIYDETTLVVESPEKDTLLVVMNYGREQWEINLRTTSDNQIKWPWPIRFGQRPDSPEDPALFITAPAGTTVGVRDV